MKAILVAGTDTGVGKTVVTGLFARFLAEKGHKVTTQKWVGTGTSDIDAHLKLMGKKKSEAGPLLDRMSVYNLRLPASPHLASQEERRKISKLKIKRAFKALSDNFDYVIVEGTGGVLVPYTRRLLLIDIAKELKLSVIVVAGNKLGAINHTILTIEALKKRKMKIMGIIFNEYRTGTSSKILADNPRIVKALTKVKILGSLRHKKNKKALYGDFIPITKRLAL